MIERPKKPSFWLGHGCLFFPCRKYSICQINVQKCRKFNSFESSSTQKCFNIKPFIPCTSKNVVYLICLCGLQYIGCSIRTVQARLSEHVVNNKKGFINHSVSKNYSLYHNKNPSGTLFLGIGRFTSNWRGSNLIEVISKLETWWIYTAKTYVPFGMNVEWEVNAFINNGYYLSVI